MLINDVAEMKLVIDYDKLDNMLKKSDSEHPVMIVSDNCFYRLMKDEKIHIVIGGSFIYLYKDTYPVLVGTWLHKGDIEIR